MHPLTPFMSTNLVLLFHVVPSQTWFRETLRVVGRIYRFISLDDIDAYFREGRNFNGACHVSFDDGDRSCIQMAIPVLREMNIPCSIFVSPKIICGEENFWFQDLTSLVRQGAEPHVRSALAEAMGCEPDRISGYSLGALFKSLPLKDVRAVLASVKSLPGVDLTRRYNISREELLALRDSELVALGAHTQNHPILAGECDESSRSEISDSVRELSDLLERPVWSFAYPNGKSGLDFGPREESFLRDCGVRLAFSTDNGFFNHRTDPLAIPRGGFEGSPREAGAWVTGKLLLTPVWDRARNLVSRRNETLQRKEIRTLATSITR